MAIRNIINSIKYIEKSKNNAPPEVIAFIPNTIKKMLIASRRTVTVAVVAIVVRFGCRVSGCGSISRFRSSILSRCTCFASLIFEHSVNDDSSWYDKLCVIHFVVPYFLYLIRLQAD